MDKPALLSQIQYLHLPHLIVRSFRINDEQEQNNLAGIIKWDNLLKLLEVSGNLIQRDLSNVENVKLSDAQKAELAEMGYTDSEDPTEVDDEPYFDPRATPWFKIKTQADNR